MNVTDLYSNLDEDLAFVEQRLQQQLHSTDTQLREASTHLMRSGGKRMRPVFVMLSGTFGTYDRERLSRIAVALELIHMATLVHDDVIDRADVRRGNPTVKARFGNQMAMYTGDFMFAQALSLLSMLDNVRLHQTFARAIERMCLGEIEQLRDLFVLDVTMHTYLRRIRRKTALLIEMSCTMGALGAEASDKDVSALQRFGYYTGMAFQVIDDVLDFTSTTEKLGKPVGSDLRQGTITAPVLFALRKPSIAASLRRLITPAHTEEDIAEAIELIRTSGAIEDAQDLANRYLVKANEALADLPATPSRVTLAALATFVGKREN